MINALTGLGYGVIGLAILLGIGVTILAVFGKSVANCPTGYTYNANTTTVFDTGKCCLTAGRDCSTGINVTEPSSATTNINTLNGYLGTSSGGLATWIPIVIVMVVGLLFLGAFFTKKGKLA